MSVTDLCEKFWDIYRDSSQELTVYMGEDLFKSCLEEARHMTGNQIAIDLYATRKLLGCEIVIDNSIGTSGFVVKEVV
jgi:hypothetical protein